MNCKKSGKILQLAGRSNELGAWGVKETHLMAEALVRKEAASQGTSPSARRREVLRFTCTRWALTAGPSCSQNPRNELLVGIRPRPQCFGIHPHHPLGYFRCGIHSFKGLLPGLRPKHQYLVVPPGGPSAHQRWRGSASGLEPLG